MSNFSQSVFGGLPGNSIMEYVTTTDTLSQITVAGYINAQTGISASDYVNASFVFAVYNGGSGLFAVNVSNGVVTLNTISDAPGNLMGFDVTVGQAALASAGSVVLVPSAGTLQYKVRSLQMNLGGTNFSGGGDRLGQITDGTTVYSVIPATNLQTLVNAQWGVSTPLPNPASAAIDTSTVAGAPLVFKYSGGATDYTAGSVVISGVVQRVA